MKDRKDIDKKYTWNLDVIYSNITEFNKDYDLVLDKINSLKKYENISHWCFHKQRALFL